MKERETLGSQETQTAAQKDAQRSDLNLRTRLLILRFGVRIPGGPPANPQIDGLSHDLEALAVVAQIVSDATSSRQLP